MIRRRAAAVSGAMFVAVATLVASAVRVTPVIVEDKVMATFSAPTIFTSDVSEAVQSGIPVTFSFTAELRRSSTLWFDRTLGTADVASTVKFDTLTTTYQVSKLKAGTVQWSQQTQKEDEMRAWMTEFDRIALTDLSAMTGEGDYYIRVRARDNLPRGFSLWPFGRGETSGRAEVSAGR